MLKLILALIMVLPATSYAQIRESLSEHKEFTLSDDKCDHDLKTLAKSLCTVTSSDLKEIHREHFRMQTEAEDSLDEWYIFSDSLMRLIKVHRFTDFNEPAYYDKNAAYCDLRVSCYNSGL